MLGSTLLSNYRDYAVLRVYEHAGVIGVAGIEGCRFFELLSVLPLLGVSAGGFGVSRKRIIIFWGLYWGPPMHGKYNMDYPGPYLFEGIRTN